MTSLKSQLCNLRGVGSKFQYHFTTRVMFPCQISRTFDQRLRSCQPKNFKHVLLYYMRKWVGGHLVAFQYGCHEIILYKVPKVLMTITLTSLSLSTQNFRLTLEIVFLIAENSCF